MVCLAVDGINFSILLILLLIAVIDSTAEVLTPSILVLSPGIVVSCIVLIVPCTPSRSSCISEISFSAVTPRSPENAVSLVSPNFKPWLTNRSSNVIVLKTFSL